MATCSICRGKAAVPCLRKPQASSKPRHQLEPRPLPAPPRLLPANQHPVCPTPAFTLPACFVSWGACCPKPWLWLRSAATAGLCCSRRCGCWAWLGMSRPARRPAHPQRRPQRQRRKQLQRQQQQQQDRRQYRLRRGCSCRHSHSLLRSRASRCKRIRCRHQQRQRRLARMRRHKGRAVQASRLV